jgi:hypothetical protein
MYLLLWNTFWSGVQYKLQNVGGIFNKFSLREYLFISFSCNVTIDYVKEIGIYRKL